MYVMHSGGPRVARMLFGINAMLPEWHFVLPFFHSLSAGTGFEHVRLKALLGFVERTDNENEKQ